MKSIKIMKNINAIYAVITGFINLTTFKFLPDRIAMQITLDGSPGNYVPKIGFVLAAPAFLGLIYFITKTDREEREIKYFLVGSIIFIINIVFIIFNLG